MVFHPPRGHHADIEKLSPQEAIFAIQVRRGSEIQSQLWQHRDVYKVELIWVNDQLEVI